MFNIGNHVCGSDGAGGHLRRDMMQIRIQSQFPADIKYCILNSGPLLGDQCSVNIVGFGVTLGKSFEKMFFLFVFNVLSARNFDILWKC